MTGVHYERGAALVTLDVILHSQADCVFLSLQFQNNNNYMNMAEANGALLAAGDVSIIYSFLHRKFNKLKVVSNTNSRRFSFLDCHN